MKAQGSFLPPVTFESIQCHIRSNQGRFTPFGSMLLNFGHPTITDFSLLRNFWFKNERGREVFFLPLLWSQSSVIFGQIRVGFHPIGSILFNFTHPKITDF